MSSPGSESSDPEAASTLVYDLEQSPDGAWTAHCQEAGSSRSVANVAGWDLLLASPAVEFHWRSQQSLDQFCAQFGKPRGSATSRAVVAPKPA